MDRYEFKHKGLKCFVADEGSRIALAVPFVDHQKRENAAAAEILNLAKELFTLRSLNNTLAKDNERAINRWAVTAEERDAAKQTAEERREIIAELAAALAVLAGETLKPCGDHNGECSGHLGPQAQDAANSALAAWHALQEGNRQAAERITELERQLADQKQHARYLGRTQEEQEELIAEARLAGELTSILQARGVVGEHYADTLRRIIREREEYLGQVQTADTLLCRCRNIYEHKVMGEHHFPSAEIADFLRDARTQKEK